MTAVAKLINNPNELYQVSRQLDLVEAFCLTYESENTRRAYSRDLQGFIRFLEEHGVPLNLTRPMVIDAYLMKLEKTTSSATSNRVLGCLKAFFAWLQVNEFVENNPATPVRARKAKAQNPTPVFTDDEAARMINSPDVTTLVGNRDRFALVLLFYLGVRRDELRKIKMKDIVIERDGTLTVTIHGKGGKNRIIPLSQVVLDEMFAYRNRYKLRTGNEINGNDYILQSEFVISHQPLDPSSIYRIVSKYATALGFDRKIGPHACRATAISQLFEKEASGRDIADFAGHSSIETSLKYDKKRQGIANSPAFKVDYKIEYKFNGVPAEVESATQLSSWRLLDKSRT